MTYAGTNLTKEELNLDHSSLTFGKYIGNTPDAVSEIDPGYIVWMYENVKNKPTCSKLLYDTCKDEVGYKSRFKEDTDELTGNDDDLLF